MKVTVLCRRSSCTPPHPCADCQRLAGDLKAYLQEIEPHHSYRLPAERTIVIETLLESGGLRQTRGLE